jgi:hypothetical protein
MSRVRKNERTYGFSEGGGQHLEATRASPFIATAEWLTSYVALAPDTTPVPVLVYSFHHFAYNLLGSCPAHHPTINLSVMSSREPMWYCHEVSSTLYSASSSAYRSSQCHAEMRPLMVCNVSSSLPIPEKYLAVQMTTLFRFPIPIVHHVMAPSWRR